MSNYLSSIFGQSPVKPLQDHISRACDAVSVLVPFFQSVIEQNWAEASTLREKVADHENEADDLKKEIRMQLPSGLFMPFSRADLLELLKYQDSLANKAKDIAGLILGRKMCMPDSLGTSMLEFVEHSAKACRQAQKTINELDELIATGFKGAEVTLVQEMVKELEEIENQTDEQQVKIRATLFGLETQLPPVEVMFLYKVIEWIGDLADQAQSVGHCLERMLAR